MKRHRNCWLLFIDKNVYENPRATLEVCNWILKASDIQLNIYHAYTYLGLIYRDWSIHDKALDYFYKAHSITEKETLPKKFQHLAMLNIAAVYNEQTEYEKIYSHSQKHITKSKRTR